MAAPFSDLSAHQHWIFDMDGTLTLAIHDFDEIRATLGLPVGKPILESIAELPEDKAKNITQQLDELEFDIAHKASAQPKAAELLEWMLQNNYTIGILTRNGREIADATLAAAGLGHYFKPHSIVSRDCCAPKPEPDGVHLLLQRWGANANDTVMTGDYLYDLKAGHLAGTATCHMDVKGEYAWPEITSLGVQSIKQLLDSLQNAHS